MVTVCCILAVLAQRPWRCVGACRLFQAFCKKSGQGAVPIEHAATISQAVEALKALPLPVTEGSFFCHVLH